MVISIMNNKGGVGKTTVTANLGVTLARFNKKVLLIDLDAQLSLSEYFFERDEITTDDYFKRNTFFALSNFDIMAKDIAVNIEKNLDIVVSSISLAGVELDLNNNYPLMENATKFFADAGKSYDYVLVDCPPNLGICTACAVLASDGVIIPVCPEPLAVRGLTLMREFLNSCRIYNDFYIAAYKVLITRMDGRVKLQKDIREAIKEDANFSDGNFGTFIPISAKLAESPLYKKTILDIEPKGKAARAFKQLAVELMVNGFKRHANSLIVDVLQDNLPFTGDEDEDGVIRFKPNPNYTAPDIVDFTDIWENNATDEHEPNLFTNNDEKGEDNGEKK